MSTLANMLYIRSHIMLVLLIRLFLTYKCSDRTKPESNFYMQGCSKASAGLVSMPLTLSYTKQISKTHQRLFEIPDKQDTKQDLIPP